MKKFLILFFIMVFGSGFVSAQTGNSDIKLKKVPLMEQKANVVIDTLAKNYIAAYMERNEGRFTIKAREGNRNLLYGGILTGGAVYTSHANFKIGDQLYTMRPSLFGANKVMPRSFNNDNSKLSVTFYEMDGVEVRQELIPRENIAKKAGAVLIKYVFKNNSGTTKRVGAVLKLDTYIGGIDNITGNDSARLSTPIGIIRNQQEIKPVPDYWLAFENIQDTSALIGRGTLRGKDLVFPEFLFVGNYEQLTTYKYDEPILSGGPYYDSEILMRWKEVLLQPGESTYFSTLYGMGEIEYQGNTLSLYCSSPFDTLTLNNNSDYEVNPFDYLVSVRNPGLTINNVKATIRLNDKTFFLVDQNGNPAPADSVRFLGELAGGEQKLATWKISTRNQCSGKEENIKVIVTGESSDTNFCVTRIYVPANRLYSLNLSADPVSGGLAEKFPNRTRYECDIPVTITATPNTGYKFIGWEGNFPGDKMENPKTFYMDTDRNIVAKFMVDSFNLDIRVSPLGAGATNPPQGIHRYKNGDNVVLTYTADPCYDFVKWSGDTNTTANRIEVNMWKNKVITAEFKIKTFRITGDMVGSGDIQIIPNPTNGDGTYNCGDSITLRAYPKNCYDFDKWVYKMGFDSGSVNVNPIGFRIKADIKGTAYFQIKKFSLTTSIDPIGSGVITKSPDKPEYDCGEVVTLTVNADKCYNFTGWDDGDKTNPRTVTMDKGSIALKALLVKKKYTIFAGTDYPESGVVTKNPAKDTLFCGDSSTLTVTQNCPYSFVKWNDNILTRSRKVYIDTNKNFTANMAKIAFEITKAEPNIFPNIVVDLKVDSILFSQNPVLVPALNRTQFTVVDEDTVLNRKTINNFNLMQGNGYYQIIYSLYGNCFDKATDLNRKTIVKFMYNGCMFEDTARYKINLNAGCDSCSRMLKRKTPNALFANRPNPFNPETKIKYSIANYDRVDLVVYDVLGREVATLVSEYKEAGEYEVTFAPKGLPSGVYLYRIKSGSFQDVKKMIYLK